MVESNHQQIEKTSGSTSDSAISAPDFSEAYSRNSHDALASSLNSDSRSNNDVMNSFASADTLLAGLEDSSQQNSNEVENESESGSDTKDRTVPEDRTDPKPDNSNPERTETISGEALKEIAERFGLSPEILETVKGLAEQFGLGQLFTGENIEKALTAAQKHGLTSYLTPENLRMAQEYAPQIMQQYGSQINQVAALAKSDPAAAIAMATSMIPEQYRGQAMSLLNGSRAPARD